MGYINVWSKNRKIIEFSQELTWREGSTNTYYFKKTKNRWHWGYLTANGPKYDEHPFATQREARDAAKDYNDGKREETDQVLKRMRAAHAESNS